MNTHAQNPLTLSVSEIKQQSLLKQVEIISHAVNIFYLDSTTTNKGALKADALELVRMLEEIEHDSQQKTSRFNVLNKAKQLIAEQVPFESAMSIRNGLNGQCLVKYSGQEVEA